MKSRAQRQRVAIAIVALLGIYLLTSQKAPDPVVDPSAAPSAADTVVAASAAPEAAASAAPDVAASPAASPVASVEQVAAASPDLAAPGPPQPSPGSPVLVGRAAPGGAPASAAPAGTPPADTKRKVLHARREIPKNTHFFPSNLERYVVERELEVYPGSEAFTEGTSSVLGLVAKDVIPAGDVLLRSSFKGANEADRMAVILEDGKRAISVNVSMENGVAGFLTQGDHVDILHHVSRDGREQTYVLLENIRVLTVNGTYRHPGAPAPPPPPGPNGPEGGGGRAQEIVRSETLGQVVFECTPQEAEFLIQAENQPGNLSLVLRGLEVSKDYSDVEPITDEFLYSGRRKTLDETDGKVTEVEIYSGTSYKKDIKVDRTEKEKPKFEDDPGVYLTPEDE